jgi:hypothetical protein
MACLIPNLVITAPHSAEENCTPLSEVMLVGTPNLAIQPATKPAAQSAAVVTLSGKASAYRVEQSTTVIK